MIDGVFEEYDHSSGKFEVVRTMGRVAPGEIVSIRFKGDRQGATYAYPDFGIVRKPAPSNSTGGADDDIPFLPTSIGGVV